LGNSEGFALAFGYWSARRAGVTPASWADTARLKSIGASGQVEYTYDSHAIMVGLELGTRSCWFCFLGPWFRRWPVDGRLYFMPRLEWANDHGVPAELADFREQAAGGDRTLSLDLSLAAAGGLSWEITRNVTIRPLRLAVAAPRLAHLLQNSLADAGERRSVAWTPASLMFMLGLGAAYQWD